MWPDYLRPRRRKFTAGKIVFTAKCAKSNHNNLDEMTLVYLKIKLHKVTVGDVVFF